MNLSIAICDNGKEIAGHLLQGCEGYPHAKLEPSCFHNPNELYEHLNGGETYDLFLLDRSALELLISIREDDGVRLMPVKTKELNTTIPFSMIVSVEAKNRMLSYQLVDGSQLLSIIFKIPFEEAVWPLLEDKDFLQVRKSAVINMRHVKSITKTSFIMIDGREINIPQYLYADVKKRFYRWM